MRIKTGEFDRLLGRNSVLDAADDELGITGGLAVDLRDQKDRVRLSQLIRDLFQIECLPHVMGEVVRSVLRMVGKRVPEGRIRQIGEQFCVVERGLANLYVGHN